MKYYFSIGLIAFVLLFFSSVSSVISAQPVSCSSSNSDSECASQNLYEACGAPGSNTFCQPSSFDARNCTCGPMPVCIPSNCPNPDDYIANTDCQLKKIFDPESEEARACCDHMCLDPALREGNQLVEKPEVITEVLSIFGKTISIEDNNRVATLINLALTTVLGLISVYTTVVGVYLAAFKAPDALEQEELVKIQKTLVNMAIGFVASWSFIFIMQFFSNVLGYGSLNELILISDTPSENSTIIQIGGEDQT